MKDQHGLDMTGTDGAVMRYDRAVTELLHFRPEMLTEAAEATCEDPTCPMAAALNAFLRLLSTEPGDAAEAARLMAEFREAAPGRRFLPREAAHLRAADAWLAGDMHGAGRVLRGVTREHPRDAVALLVGHQIDFFTGDALALRDRVAEVTGGWPQDHPHFGPVLGMLAFGLEEAGDYARAEDTGRRAVEMDGADVWGIHAVTHSFEMRARVRDGLDRDRRPRRIVQVAGRSRGPRGGLFFHGGRSAVVCEPARYKEFWTANRLEGYAVFATLSIPLGGGPKK
jgi:hypothetical protein